MEGNYLSPIIDAFKPILIFAVVLWGAETIITMLIKDHKKAKRKQAREKRRLEYQDRRMANDAEHAKVTRAMRYDVLRRDNFHCVRCGRGKEDGVKLHVDHIVPVSRGGKSVMSNLQTLCEDCNCGKGNRYDKSWDQKLASLAVEINPLALSIFPYEWKTKDIVHRAVSLTRSYMASNILRGFRSGAISAIFTPVYVSCGWKSIPSNA